MADESGNSDFENLAELVATGATVRGAAESLGIAEKSAYRISGKPEFKAAVYKIRTEKTEGLSALALGAAGDALESLQSLAKGAEKESDQIAACKAILAQVLPLAETAELRRRLDELEQQHATEESEETQVAVG